jgi:hypothetical protein
MAELPEIYTTDEGLKQLADYLRSLDGVKIRHSIEHGRRVDYFKGAPRFLHLAHAAEHVCKGWLH